MPDTFTVLSDVPAVARAAADLITREAHAAITARGRFSLCLSGGSTPKALYQLLASEHLRSIDWSKVHLWWGDERFVPASHKDHNAAAAIAALGDIARRAVLHPVPTDAPTHRAAAEQYERELRAFDSAKPLDLVLLGMGTDGHTASLFPGEAALHEQSRWVVETFAPPASPARDRITLTYPALAAAGRVVFMVTGADKAPMLTRVRAGDNLPAAHVRCPGGVTWLVDRAAAG